MNKSVTRALLARPFVFAGGAAASAFVNASLQTGPLLVWVVAIFSGSTLAVYGLHQALGDHRGAEIVGRFSPALSLLGWGTLATFTGGLESPFVAGIFFEIALAVVSFRPRGVLWVSAGGVAVLAFVQTLYGFMKGWQLFLLETFFVMAIGGLGSQMSGRRRASEMALATQGQELGSRLESLQRELEDERAISRVGENVARLAHGLKNAVHSLRGFVSLIEPRLEAGKGTDAALVGLRTAIDDLEKLARLTLDTEVSEAGPAASPRSDGKWASLEQAVHDATSELSSASPGVRWAVQLEPDCRGARVGLGSATLLELLVILLRNAVEAMAGEGAGTVRVERNGNAGRLIVEDQGPGFAEEDLGQIFQPGFTTKEKGSGFGLFLARRIVEDHGGTLEIASPGSGGARVVVELPLLSSGSEG